VKWLPKIWAHVSTIPAWIWAVLGWVAALAAWQISRAWRARAELERKRLTAHVRLRTQLDAIRVRKERRLHEVREAHTDRKEEIEEMAVEIRDATSDEDVADLVNSAFGGDQ